MTVTFDWLALLPVLAPGLAAVLVLVVDAIAPARRGPVVAVTALGLLAGLAGAVANRLAGGATTLCPPTALVADEHALAASTCLHAVTPTGATLQTVAMLAGLAAVALLLDRRGDDRTDDIVVVLTTVLAGTTGAAVTVGARDLGSWLVGLELATLPFVALLALRAVRGRGAAAIDLLVTAVLSFALAAVGAGLWVAATGSLRLDAVMTAGPTGAARTTLGAGAVLLVLAAAFKLALVPFHVWAPGAYARGGAAVTTALAGVSTVGGLGAILVVVDALGSGAVQAPATRTALGLVGAVSLVIGAVMAWRQDDLLRLLAWSGVTQGGWVAVAAAVSGAQSAAGYLAVYVVAVVTVLAVVAAAGRRIDDHAGLARRSPLLGGALAVGLLTLAGLPPAVVGLVAKILVLDVAVAAGAWWLVVAAVVGAVVALAVYLRWLGVALRPASDDRAEDDPAEDLTGRLTPFVAVAGAGLLIAASIAPRLLL